MSVPTESFSTNCASLIRRGAQSTVTKLIFASAIVILLVAIVLPQVPHGENLGSYVSSLVRLPGVKNETAKTPFVDEFYDCHQNYTVEVLSIDPLVVYINDFLRDVEIDHLIATTQDEFHESWVFDKNTNKPVISERRSSTSARISPADPVSQCLFERMKTLLGNMQHQDVEPLQVVKYEVGQRFAGHMDWFDEPKNMTTANGTVTRSYNRLATVFAYLEDDCVGGETYFPRLKGVSSSADESKYIKTSSGKGLVVRPRRRNALFWNNLHPNGTGDTRLLHGGATVTSGTKIGLNMFSMGYLDIPLIGGAQVPVGNNAMGNT